MVSLAEKNSTKKSFWYNKNMYTKNEELRSLRGAFGSSIRRNDVLVTGELGAGRDLY